MQHWILKFSLNGFGYAVFCYAIFCSSCASFTNRRKALRGDMTRYICCNGDWPCSGKMKEQSCPNFCLCTEVCSCCLWSDWQVGQSDEAPAP